MKRQIRKGVFETNSSSMHSVTISQGTLSPNRMEIHKGRYIKVGAGEFGWGLSKHRDQETKLEYLLMMVVETEHPNNLEEFLECEGFKKLNEAISSYCGCDRIVPVNFNFRTESYEHNGELRSYVTHDGYIDHQSCEYNNLDDFLSENNTDILDFVFNPNVVLVISNDNQ